jgi:hypothetical protein
MIVKVVGLPIRITLMHVIHVVKVIVAHRS